MSNFQDRFLRSDYQVKYTTISLVESEMVMMIVGTICFMIFCLMTMVLVRWHYRKKLEKKLVEIHQQFEPQRAHLEENRENEAQHVKPIPLSPPISDQTEYNIVAGALRDDKKRQLF
ncbi:unnamed protein product [Caenorhabditis angaria]|uniref:Uncharacterized protein n=1 Tax=Caenorhabditis angaria TaxID=860376 RepID=A0A9P1IBN0_9PELO|nr:unnamed protein product [Caenorhabditis angaria]